MILPNLLTFAMPLLPRERGGVAKGGEFGQPNEPTTMGKSGQPDELGVEATHLVDDVTKLATKRMAATRNAQPAQAAGKASVAWWLVDTGCGYDLIENKKFGTWRSLSPAPLSLSRL